MSEELFPSGPWTGFYNYSPGDRHRMELGLAFDQGIMIGQGNDDLGAFLIKGRYDLTALECHWTKSYLGAHNVFYQGFREGKGIWGTWELANRTGGFHIWPRLHGEMEEGIESEQLLEAAEAITPQSIPSTMP